MKLIVALVYATALAGVLALLLGALGVPLLFRAIIVAFAVLMTLTWSGTEER